MPCNNMSFLEQERLNSFTLVHILVIHAAHLGIAPELVTKALEDNGLSRHLLSWFPLQYSARRSQAQPQPVPSVNPFLVVRVELEMHLGHGAMAGSQPFTNVTQGWGSPLLPMLWLPSHIVICVHRSWRGNQISPGCIGDSWNSLLLGELTTLGKAGDSQ